MRIATEAPAIEIRPKDTGVGVFTVCRVKKGEEISRAQGVPREAPSRETLQVDESLHLDCVGAVDAKINHSCDPNAMVSYSKLSEVVTWALRDIDPGEEVRINYCASEEDMAEPFECNCGFSRCYGTVKGFVHLDPARRRELRGLLSPFLERKHGASLDGPPQR